MAKSTRAVTSAILPIACLELLGCARSDPPRTKEPVALGRSEDGGVDSGPGVPTTSIDAGSPSVDSGSAQSGSVVSRIRPTRGERQGPRHTEEDNIIDDSPACKKPGVVAELRIDEGDEPSGHWIRASVKNCSEREMVLLRDLALDVVDANGVHPQLEDSRANRKYDNTRYCPMPLRPGEERRIGQALAVFKDGLVTAGPFTARHVQFPVSIKLTFEGKERECMGRAPTTGEPTGWKTPKGLFTGPLVSPVIKVGATP